MQITSVNYNYTNQKAQKNNSKPAFGMAMTTTMERFVGEHIEEIAKAGRNGDQYLLSAVEIIRSHPTRVHYREGIGFSAGKKFVMERNGISPLDYLRMVAEALTDKRHARDLPHKNTLMQALLAGRLKTVKDCQNI